MPGTIATPLVPQLPVAGVYTLIVTPQSVDSSGNYTDTSPSVAVSTLVTNLDINIQNELTSIKPMTQTLENNVKTGQANTFSFSGIVTALQTGISMSALTYTVSYVKIVLVRGAETFTMPICIFDSYAESHTEQGVFFTATFRACGVAWTRA